MHPWDEFAASPHVSIERHVRSAILTLGRQLGGRKAVYLDTNFWIILRKALLGEGTKRTVHLLDLLRAKVASGQIFCPISDAVFHEIIKQTDPASRIDTAIIVDELSIGVSLITQRSRIHAEISYFMHSFSHGHDLEPLKHLVWCKIPYCLGFVHLDVPKLGPHTNLTLQKSTFNVMWSTSLQHLMATSTISTGGFDQDRITRDLNEGIGAHKGELRSFAQAYAIEANGIAEVCSEIAANVMVDIAAKKGIALNAPTLGELQESKRQFKNLMRVVLVKNKGRDILRSMHILATLHASLRWDKARKLKDNDLPDFNHATAALAYCDAFFTEAPLRAMVTASNVALDKRYGCHVIATIDEAIAYLETSVLSVPNT
jgi:hypothetical protein